MVAAVHGRTRLGCGMRSGGTVEAAGSENWEQGRWETGKVPVKRFSPAI